MRLIRLMVYLFTYIRDICIFPPFRLTIIVTDAGSFLLFFVVDWSKMEFNFISYFTCIAFLPSVLFTQPTIALVALACFFSCAVRSWLYILFGCRRVSFPSEYTCGIGAKYTDPLTFACGIPPWY